MRKLIFVFGRPRDERGVSAVFFGLAITVLIGALGLSVDVGNVAYERTKAQHAADAAARHLAERCAKSDAACVDLASRAQEISDENFEGGAVTSVDASTAPTSVTVEVGKTVETPLLGFIGSDTKDVAASATASVSNEYPTEGYPVLPLGVGLCTWEANPPVDDEAEAVHINLRTDTLETVADLLSGLTGLLSGLLPLDSLVDSLLGTDAREDACNFNGAELLQLKGAVWLAGLSGVLLDSCETSTAIDVTGYVGSIGNGIVMPAACTHKFGSEIKVGSTILLPIYVPDSNLQNYGFKALSTCATISIGRPSINKVCLEVPPKIGVRIVGFAPFKVTGWNFGNYHYSGAGQTHSPDPEAPPCPNLSIGLPLRNILQTLITSIPLVGSLILWPIVRLLLNPLNNGGNLETALGCTAIQGYFTKSLTKDPNFKYSADGADFGAKLVKLTK